MSRVSFCLAAFLLFACALIPIGMAQSAPLPYGTVASIGSFAQANCTNGGWVTNMSCAHGTMHCDASLSVDDLGFKLGYLAPSGTIFGTVVAFSGGPGMAPGTAIGGEVQSLQTYLANGFEVVQVAWDTDWEAAQSSYLPLNPYGNILNAACRPAGILHYVRNTSFLFQSGGMCAQGFSAGSAAIAYSLAWYGAGWGSTRYIDNVELLSGPVLSRVDLGCKWPLASNVTVCGGSPNCREQSGVGTRSVSPEYVDGFENYPRAWSNIYACANSTNPTTGVDTSAWNGIWDSMSILSPSITSQQKNYTNTSMNAWLCLTVDGMAEPMNNSSSQGWLFYQATTWDLTTSVVNAVTNSQGPEGVYGSDATAYDGVKGNVGTLIAQDMVAHCAVHP